MIIRVIRMDNEFELVSYKKKDYSRAIYKIAAILYISLNNDVVDLMIDFATHSEPNTQLYRGITNVIVPIKFVRFNNTVSHQKQNKVCIYCDNLPNTIKIQPFPRSWKLPGLCVCYTCNPCGIDYLFDIKKSIFDGIIEYSVTHSTLPRDIPPGTITVL